MTLEGTVLQVWADVLGVDGPAADDDFLELGGDSLKAIQLASRLAETLGVEVPLLAVFEHSTPRRLAASLGGRAAPPAEPIAPLTGGRRLLSFGQLRLWFLETLGSRCPCYNEGGVIGIRGPLDVEALRRALDRVVDRHEVLRNRLVVGDDLEPLQEPDPTPRPACPMVDLGEVGRDGREAAAERLAVELAAEPFALHSGPPARWRLLRLDGEDHRLAVAVHHIAFDGWSAGVLVHELAAEYGAATGRSAPRPPLPLRFADFAAWQREQHTASRMAGPLRAMRHMLAGVPDVLELPTDRQRPAFPSGCGARVPLELPAELSARVRAVARAEGATPFMVLLSVFGALLSGWSGQERLVVGSAVANRGDRRLEDVVGFFANTLAIPLDVRGRPTFRELLARARQSCLEAFAHQELPFEQLVEALRPARDLSRSPVLQATLVMRDASRLSFCDELEWEWTWLDLGTAKFDVVLDLADGGGPLAGFLEYRTDLWRRETMERLGRALVALADTATADPSRALDLVGPG